MTYRFPCHACGIRAGLLQPIDGFGARVAELGF